MELTLHTERLTLRPAGPEDAGTTFRYTGDRDNTRYMLFLPHSDRAAAEQSLQNAAAEWSEEQPSFYEFAVLLEGEHVGGVSLFLEEDRLSGELGWILRRDCWGCGYAAEAARAVMDFARGLGVEEIHAHCDARNTRSVRVMEKLGLIYRETGPRQYPDGRGSGEEHLYSIRFSKKS